MHHYYYGFWDTWANQQKVVFDGPNKLILINPGVKKISVKEDIYSDWKEWVTYQNNAQYLRAIRVIGGDPVGGGLFAGDIYFLQNGWQVVITDRVEVEGVLYHDDGIDPYVVLDGGGLISTVSNLVQTVSTAGGADVDYNRIGDIVRNELNANQTVDDIVDRLITINTKVQSIDSSVDLTEVLASLDLVESKIDETQAFVLSAD